MPFIVSAFGVILSMLLTMVVGRLAALQQCIDRSHSQIEALQAKSTEYAVMFSKIEQQIKEMLHISQYTHERVDRIEARQG